MCWYIIADIVLLRTVYCGRTVWLHDGGLRISRTLPSANTDYVWCMTLGCHTYGYSLARRRPRCMGLYSC